MDEWAWFFLSAAVLIAGLLLLGLHARLAALEDWRRLAEARQTAAARPRVQCQCERTLLFRLPDGTYAWPDRIVWNNGGRLARVHVGHEIIELRGVAAAHLHAQLSTGVFGNPVKVERSERGTNGRA